MFRAAQFDKLLDKATSNLRLDTDWPTIIQICDLIRQNDCSPRYAVSSIKKKLYSQNPHQAMFALLVLESIAKNCGSVVHDEITSKATMEMLRDLVKTSQHENLRNKTLELIQAWAFAFRNSPKYRAVQDTMNIMKADGYKFPPLKESDAMFSADTAPEWSDGDVCHRCRTTFSLMIRKHHCRACGQVFCQQCSGKTSTIPKFGIEKEVRVCDACFDKVSRPPSTSFKTDSIDTASDYGPAVQQAQKRPPGAKSQEELQEEEELQLALALSQSEAEQKEKERKRPTSSAPPSTHHSLSPVPSSMTASPERLLPGAGPELSRYLDRTYWEHRREAAPPTTSYAAQHEQEKSIPYSGSVKSLMPQEDGPDAELEDFVAALRSQIEIFVNRMKSDSSRGRSIANDTSVQTLFMNITAMHSRLLRYIQQQDDSRVHYESLQDKVSQTRDSRAALDTLREEHAARLAAAAEAAERQRQLQMAHKLHTMRKKKHEYLQYQRQLALQRVQEQEREMQMRQEQQKQQYLMGGSNYFIQNQPMPYPNSFPHQAMYPNQQFHQGMPTDQSGQPLNQMGQPQMTQPSMMMGQPMQGMSRPGNPNQPQLTPMMMQMRMAMPIHPGNLQGPQGQPGAPPQSPSMKGTPTSQPNHMNPQMSIGQPMPPNTGAPIQMGVRAPGIPAGHPMHQVGPHGQPNANQPQMQIPNQMPQVPQAPGQMGMPNQMQQQAQMQNQMQPQAPTSLPNQIPQHQRQNPVTNQMQPHAPPMQTQQQVTQPQPLPQQMVNQPQKMSGQQPQMTPHMSGQPQQMVAQQMGAQQQQMGVQPQPQQMVAQQQIGSQPQQMVPQQQMGAQPQQVQQQQQQMGAQQQQIGAQQQQMGAQQQQMGAQPQPHQLVSQPQHMPTGQPINNQIVPRAPPPSQGAPAPQMPSGTQPTGFPSTQPQPPSPPKATPASDTEKNAAELISFD